MSHLIVLSQKLNILEQKVHDDAVRGTKDVGTKHELTRRTAAVEEKNEQDKLENIKKLRRKRIKPFFIWKLEFSEVFKDSGGFDVVIANPPYVDSEEMTKSNKSYRKTLTENYESTKGN